MNLPEQYQWLNNEGAPKMLVEALRHYGIMEHVGKGSNPDITQWAKEVNVLPYYPDDDTPWCGLLVGVVAKRCGYPFVNTNKTNLLRARDWQYWGNAVPIDRAMLWDVLVFSRNGGGHVAFYVGETATAFLVYGGNQSNKVGFTWIAKSRCIAVRRPAYRIGEPANVRKIYLTQTGALSINEA